MSYLESVRDRLREEHEERMEPKKQRVRVVEFQLQLKSSKFTAKELLQKIDSSAPIPQPLEGGDGNGPLYQCIVWEKKMDRLQQYCEDNHLDIKISSGGFAYFLEESLYRPDYYVQWQMGKSPTVSANP